MSITPNSPNFFDAPGVLPEPTELRAGDSWKWRRAFDGFAPADGWTLKYVLNRPGNGQFPNPAGVRFAFPDGSVVATADGSAFDVAVAAADTAGCVAGIYDIYAVLTNSGTLEQRTVELESVNVRANIAAATAPVDTRSFVKRTLDAIEAAIAGDSSPMVQEYEVHGRRVRYMERRELLALRAQFKTEYRAEQIKAGEFVPKRAARISFGCSS